MQEGNRLSGAYHHLIALQKYAAHCGRQALGFPRRQRVENPVAEEQSILFGSAATVLVLWPLRFKHARTVYPPSSKRQ
jgi:hypothetical protein